MTDIMIKMLGLAAVAGFGIIGTIQWIKQIMPDNYEGRLLPIISFTLCVISGFAIYASELKGTSAWVIIITTMLCLTFSQLGFEGLVKPILHKVLGNKNDNTDK